MCICAFQKIVFFYLKRNENQIVSTGIKKCSKEDGIGTEGRKKYRKEVIEKTSSKYRLSIQHGDYYIIYL